MFRASLFALALVLAAFAFRSSAVADAPFRQWKQSGSLYLLTTPDGANLPATAVENDVPVLVRLHRDTFDFAQAKPNGADLRFSTPEGKVLSYQIEQWDAKIGTAAIWVRIPNIKGNARQEIKVHWGNADALDESSGPAVFGTSNGYLGVLHMQDPTRDEIGTLNPVDVGTDACEGIIGKARRFGIGRGIQCGEKIAGFPKASDSHTTEAWFRAEKPNGRVVAWGNEHAQGKVVMQYRSPPHVRMECYFSGADVGSGPVPMSRWVHVVHTYQKGDSRLYVNGVLDSVSKTNAAPLAIKSPARMWIGGWYNNFDFVGDIDEVRISSVVRSPDWVKLGYENQKPFQTLAGLVVQSGDTFSVSQSKLEVPEGGRASLTAKAGGAQKVYWIIKRGGFETVAAVDRLTFDFDAGRVTGDESLVVCFKAVYPTGIKTKDIPVIIKEHVPEPVFTLNAPETWNGRDPIEVVPKIANLREMAAQGAGELSYDWSVADIAVIKESLPGRLLLKRANKSGKLTVTLAVRNGGAAVVRRADIVVTEPKTDPWVDRVPGKDEMPVDNQFIPRDNGNVGVLHCNGVLKEKAESVFLKVYADDKLDQEKTGALTAGNGYALSAKIKAGLIKYKVEFGIRNGGRETVLHVAGNIVCGDAYLINGQSNADATDVGKEDPLFTSEWIRTYGSMAGHPEGARTKKWGNAVCRNRKGGELQIGYWGLELARRLVESQKVPICIINGAVGGSRIDQHQRNAAEPQDVKTIYGRLLWRVREAKLTHGIRAVLWHQGENDQGADGPTGGYGWETYRDYFITLSAGWKQDYPNVQHYYLFQIWPRACSMGVNGSDNALREVQRTLPAYYSNLHVMSTLGVKPPGGCHFPLAGYAEFARLLCPLVERDLYGKTFATSITPPDLKRAQWTTDKRDELTLEFDQPVTWSPTLAGQFSLDGSAGSVISGVVTGQVLTLKLKETSSATKVTYLDSKTWSEKNLLLGTNGIAALTFWNVPIAAKPTR